MAEPLTYTVPQAAELTGLTEHWLREKCRIRQIPHLLADQYRFTQAHIDSILTMHERPPVQQASKEAPTQGAEKPRRRVRSAPVSTGSRNVVPLVARPVERSRRRRSAS